MAAILARVFEKLSFASHDQYDVDGWVESKHAIYFVRFVSRLRTFCKETIAYEQYEPEVGEKRTNLSDKSDSGQRAIRLSPANKSIDMAPSRS